MYQHPNQGCQKKREQEIENLFEKIMTGKFPNLVREIDIQIQEVQRVPNKMNPKRLAPQHITIKAQKVKNKEIIKSSKRKPAEYLKSSSHKTVNSFLNRNLAGQQGLAGNIQSDEKQGATTKITLPSKAII